MKNILESRKDNFLITTDQARLDLNAIADMLTRAYWAKNRTPELIARSMQNSLVFGVYDGSRQIGLARVVSDYATFAWLCDVFVLRGLSRAWNRQMADGNRPRPPRPAGTAPLSAYHP